ncbi:MAG: diaminopimelate epimerase [bacterium JZ-2024 1]
MRIRFYKCESAGNDFLLFLGADQQVDAMRPFLRDWCERRKGIGADGVVFLDLDAVPPHFRIFNADGSEAEVSGNGLRCAAILLAYLVPNNTGAWQFLTRLGIRAVTPDADGRLAVEMGSLPGMSDFTNVFVEINGKTYEFQHTRFPGNPHTIFLASSSASLADDFPVVAPRVEKDLRFPDRTNVEFVFPVSPGVVEVRVWERGVGETASCGSGAAAISALLYHRTPGKFPLELRFPGGSILGDVRHGKVFVSAYARLVCEGEFL